jgi:hypothetical protein
MDRTLVREAGHFETPATFPKGEHPACSARFSLQEPEPRLQREAGSYARAVLIDVLQPCLRSTWEKKFYGGL